MNSYVFHVTPVSKPRMTKSDKWKQRSVVTRYWDYKDELIKQAKAQGFMLADVFTVVFYLPMPTSWSKKKKRQHVLKPHQQKPDKDNLTKGLKDALLPEDQTVWQTHEYKLWSDTDEGYIVIFQ